MEQHLLDKNKKGFSTLLIVIILGSIVLAFMLYVSTSALWSVRGSIDDKNSVQADQLASSCAEIALQSMRENNSFFGSGNASLNSNTCSYNVINSGGNSRIINITGIVNGITRKLQITTNGFNPITISSWKNIADF